MKRGGFDSGPFEYNLENGFDPYHAFVGLMPRFVDLARDAAQTQAVSHRNFHVGAAMYVADQASSRVATLDGANLKPTESDPKYCAEMSVLDQARSLGFSRAIGIVIAGTSDPEKIKSVSGIATPTLHPCDACRHHMEESGLLEDSSLVITVSSEEDFYEVHTYKEMIEFWASPIERDPRDATVPYDADLWHWRQATYGRNMVEVPDSQPWRMAELALKTSVGPVG